MAKRIKIIDREFEIFIKEEEINSAVARIAQQINTDFKNKEIIFLSVLSGAMIFTVDLIRMIEVPCKLTFLKVTSYENIKSTGSIAKIIGIDVELASKNVILVEDIVDTGLTLTYIMNELKLYSPKTLKIASLLVKPSISRFPYNIDYLGFKIPDYFVVGYGLDYNGYGRNLKSIYKLVE